MKRYAIDTRPEDMAEDADGEWVRWEDVENLIKERDQLVQQNHRLVGRIDELKAGDP